MKDSSKPKQLIGRAEIISFPNLEIDNIHARIDTGARTSAIWASHAKIENNKLAVIFFGKNHEKYSGKKFYFEEFSEEIINSSIGIKQKRFKIKITVALSGRRIKSSFTLADRSSQVYPVLIGRNVLRGKFIVDVKMGKALIEEEKKLKELKMKMLDNGTGKEQ